MSLAPFSMPRRSRRLSFSRSIPTLPGTRRARRTGPPLRIGRPAGRLTSARRNERAAPAAMLAAVLVRRGISGLVLALALAGGAGGAGSQEDAGAAAPDQPAELERLLTLPGGQSYDVDR